MTCFCARALPLALFAALLAPLGGGAAAQRQPHRQEINSRYGVNAHIPTTDDFKAMQRAGIGWARIDLTWDVMEPEPGRYRWDIVDRVASDAEAHGVRLLGILGYCPPWVSSGPDQYYPPKDRKAWKRFVAAIVSRYRGRIRHWSLWNEPNSDTFFHGTMDQFIEEVLIPGARAAKEADPDCKIVGPELAHLSGSRWDEWLEGLLSKAGDSFDVIAHHCYQGNPKDVFRNLDGRKWPWEPTTVQRILGRTGQEGKPFWLTEVGWRSTETGEEKQAIYLKSVLRGVHRRNWIAKVFLFELRDSPGLVGYGLLRLDRKEKPSFSSVQKFIRNHPQPRAKGPPDRAP